MEAAILLLVVEDEKMTRDVLEAALADGGFALELASDGVEAVRLLDERRDAVRGLITDIQLGAGLDGWDVARRARELVRDIPVIYMSGAAGHDWASRGVPNSIFIAKPFAPAQIITAISGLLNAKDSYTGP